MTERTLDDLYPRPWSVEETWGGPGVIDAKGTRSQAVVYERRAKQERASVCKRVRVPIKSITKLRVYDPDVVLTEGAGIRWLNARLFYK